MLSNFLNSFSDSFMLAIFLWPFAALLLTFPLLLIQYIRFHRLPKGRVAVLYLFMLYVLALVAFTLYPLPDNPIKFCADYNLSPQLNPIQFIADIQKDGMRAVLQIVMNVAFFVPLGVFLRNLFGRKVVGTIIIAFLVSLLIETAQLTGAFGVFPCSYRLFDIDDLALNTIGAFVGYLIAFVLPNLSRPEKRKEVNTRPGLVHRLLTFIADLIMLQILTILVLLPPHIFWSGSVWKFSELVISLALFVLLQFIVPFVSKGQTIFARLTGITIDDQDRTPLNRFLLYAVRMLLISAVLLWPFDTPVPTIIIIVTFIYWIIRRKMPYTLVDIFFKKPKKK